jgi:hypothetical protein
MAWTSLRFGKHCGKTLPQVLFMDPDWFFWAYEQRAFDGSGPALQAEAERLNLLARRLKVPQGEGEPRRVVRYIIDRPPSPLLGRTRVAGFHLIPEGPSGPEAGETLLKPYIDLSVPRRFGGYDKTAYQILIVQVKELLFGSPRVRMTKERCEAFFDDDNNFDLGPGGPAPPRDAQPSAGLAPTGPPPAPVPLTPPR